MPDSPTPDQSFTIHLQSLLDFADEFKSQISGIQAPMDRLAALSGKQPQYGAFPEAWSLGSGEVAAVEEMFSLLERVRTAAAFAGDVTAAVANGYRKADEAVSAALGGPVQAAATGLISGLTGQNQNQQGANGGRYDDVYRDSPGYYPPHHGAQGTDPGSAVGPAPGGLWSPPAAGAVQNAGYQTTGYQTTGYQTTSTATSAPAGAGPAAPNGAQPTGSAPAGAAPAAPAWPPADPAGSTPPPWTDYFRGTPQGGA